MLPFAACKKEEAPKASAEGGAGRADHRRHAAWRAYVTDVVTRNMGGVTNQPYVYLLPGESTADFQGSSTIACCEKAQSDVARGIVSGNMLAFASPASAKMADMVVAAFKAVPPGTMKGVKVLFIGKADDSERVKAAVAPAGVDYVFVEAK